MLLLLLLHAVTAAAAAACKSARPCRLAHNPKGQRRLKPPRRGNPGVVTLFHVVHLAPQAKSRCSS